LCQVAPAGQDLTEQEINCGVQQFIVAKTGFCTPIAFGIGAMKAPLRVVEGLSICGCPHNPIIKTRHYKSG